MHLHHNIDDWSWKILSETPNKSLLSRISVTRSDKNKRHLVGVPDVSFFFFTWTCCVLRAFMLSADKLIY